jgi:hypothetical protein
VVLVGLVAINIAASLPQRAGHIADLDLLLVEGKP